MTRLERLVVTAEPWQLFFSFISVLTFNGIVSQEHEALKIASSILLAVVIFGWFLILGKGLNENLPEDEQKSDALFIISCFYTILLSSIFAILDYIPIDAYMKEELMGYVVALGISVVASVFYMMYFASTLFVQNQDRFLDKEKLSAEATFLLFIVFIFGVLILQTRVRKFFHKS
jgi:hypothetical protein